jgi:hypothetical protein
MRARLPTAAATLRRNLKAATMDEVQTATFKATTDDKLPPKEKHVLTLVRLIGEADAPASAVDAELAKRLQGCRSPKTACVAAKALVVMHRICLAGHGDALPESARAVVGVCASAQGHHAQSEYVAACAAYMRELCVWGGAGSLRAPTDAPWHGLGVRDLLRALPLVQSLCGRALEAAQCRHAGHAALHCLRMALLEDALALYRAQHAGAVAVHAALLQLPPAYVHSEQQQQQQQHGGVVVGGGGDGGSGGGDAVSVLDASRRLTVQAVVLDQVTPNPMTACASHSRGTAHVHRRLLTCAQPRVLSPRASIRDLFTPPLHTPCSSPSSPHLHTTFSHRPPTPPIHTTSFPVSSGAPRRALSR